MMPIAAIIIMALAVLLSLLLLGVPTHALMPNLLVPEVVHPALFYKCTVGAVRPGLAARGGRDKGRIWSTRALSSWRGQAMPSDGMQTRGCAGLRHGEIHCGRICWRKRVCGES